jgi:hypothetical protein
MRQKVRRTHALDELRIEHPPAGILKTLRLDEQVIRRLDGRQEGSEGEEERERFHGESEQ